MCFKNQNIRSRIGRKSVFARSQTYDRDDKEFIDFSWIRT